MRKDIYFAHHLDGDDVFSLDGAIHVKIFQLNEIIE